MKTILCFVGIIFLSGCWKDKQHVQCDTVTGRTVTITEEHAQPVIQKTLVSRTFNADKKGKPVQGGELLHTSTIKKPAPLPPLPPPKDGNTPAKAATSFRVDLDPVQ